MNNITPTTEWLKDPEIFAVNRIKPHSDHKYTVNADGENISLKQSLNGTWKFTFSENPLNREINFYKTDFDIDKLNDIQVPGHMSLQGYGQVQYTNVMYPWDGVVEGDAPTVSDDKNESGGYVKDVIIDKKLLGKRIFISFQGVATAFYLYVNDKFVGYAEDSFTPSEFEITDYVTEGVNRIGVEVWQRSTGDWLEDQDFWRLYGIFRDVYLYAIPDVHVRDIFVRTDIEEDYRTASLSVEAEVLNADGSTVDIMLSDMDGKVVAEKKNLSLTEQFRIKLEAGTPALWSAETPYLYDLTLKLYKSGIEQETVYVKTGFRRFEMKNKIMHLNGKRIEFRGVNRHEFSHKGGRCVTEEEMLWDIMFMKQHNINAVRTCHYPDATRWYELCDEYGIYLIDETNLETHGTWSCDREEEEKKIIPGSRPEWLDIVIDRASSMFNRDKNHPSVLIWSCGNESHCGENIYKMSEFFRSNDPSRLVHYEGVWTDRRYDGATDMETRMYTKPWDIEKYLTDNPQKPFISCEYSHAMGNSNGGLNEYTALYDKYPMYQGGFIWDYIDQSLEKDDGYGGKMLAYGGDFGDRPNDNDFCVNGLIFGDRRTTPKMQELKYLYQPISLDVCRDGINIKNRNLFTGTEDYMLEAWMLIDGVQYGKTEIVPDVPALSEKFVNINLPVPMLLGEHIMQARLVLNRDLPWAKKGHEVAFGEKIIISRFDMELKGCGSYGNTGIRMVKGSGNTGVYCDNVPSGDGRDMSVSYMFDKGKGLVSVKKNGREFLAKEAKPCFYRASTDNDRGNGYMFDSGVWQYAQKWLKVSEYSDECNDGSVKITYKYELPLCENGMIAVKGKCDGKGRYDDDDRQGIIVEMTYVISADGSCSVSAKYPGAHGVPELPLFGVQMVLDRSFDKYSYYGKGPMENYLDRNCGARFGIFDGAVADNLTEYIIPGGCGNRTEVRSLSMCSGCDGIEFRAEKKPMECSMLHYNDTQLEEAYHVCELPRPTYTFVKLMAKQLGVGGDDSWGAQTHVQYRIPGDEPLELNFVINVLELGKER